MSRHYRSVSRVLSRQVQVVQVDEVVDVIRRRPVTKKKPKYIVINQSG